MDTTVLQHTKQSHFNEAMQILWKKIMYLTHKVVTENIKYGPVYSIIPVKTINY